MAQLGDRKGTVAYAAPTITGQGNQDVRISYAPGTVLGPDGFFHPLEGDATGGLKTAVTEDVLDVFHEMLMELRRIRMGLALLTDDPLEYTDAQED